MKYLGKIGGPFITDAGGYFTKEHIGLFLKNADRSIHAAAGEIGVEGGVSILAKQAAEVGLRNAHLVADALHAQGLCIVVLDILYGAVVELLGCHFAVKGRIAVKQQAVDAGHEVAIRGGTVYELVDFQEDIRKTVDAQWPADE